MNGNETALFSLRKRKLKKETNERENYEKKRSQEWIRDLEMFEVSSVVMGCNAQGPTVQ